VQPARLFRISAALSGPNRFQWERKLWWLISAPHQEILDDAHEGRGHPYIITTRRMTSGDPSK
jgi:hypothetical protein